MQIERESVAEVHGGGGVEARAEIAAEREARLGTLVSRPRLAAAGDQTDGGTAQRARDVDRVAGTRAIAAQGFAARHGAGRRRCRT